MNKAEQKEFVRGLSKSIAESICEQIDAGKIPENWDGHEFRSLLAFRHEASASISNVMSEKRGKRARDFKNTILVNNL